jgi:hypothetical protein
VDPESEALAAKRILFVLLTLTGLGACSPTRPDTPTFAADVQPIFVAHCTRCHGAGDRLQADPAVTNPKYNSVPLQGFLQYFDDQGDCSTPDGGLAPDPPICMRGAKFYATGGLGSGRWTSYFPDMPPAPAAPLNSHELDIILRWIQNPICGSGPLCGDDGGTD